MSQKIGEWIREQRKEKKLSQTALAKMIGVRQADVCRWEKGKHEPTVETVIKICDSLDTDLDEFMKNRKQ